MLKYQLPHMGGSTISTRLMAKLLTELRSGEYAHTDRLPSELELAERFGVSRSVIRDVLSDLEREGFIQRGRGIGTLIHREIVNLTGRLDVKFEYNELVRGTGYTPTTDSVRVYEKPADEALAERLDIDIGEPLIVCEKRVLASGQPVIFSVDHLPVSLFSGIDYRTMDWGLPVFDLLESHCGIVVDSDVAKVTATMGSPAIRQTLKVPDDEALLYIDEVGYYKLSQPILQTFGFYTNFFDFTILRKKL